MTRRALVLIAAFALASGPALAGADTATCDGKRSWQRDVVRRAIADWLRGEPRPDALLELIQAEQGIAACAGAQRGRPTRLHLPTLSPGMSPEQLGAVLLANELEWSGLSGRPEQVLAGRHFTVYMPAGTSEGPWADAEGDAP